MYGTFLMASTSSITMQSLGKIVQRAPAVGAKTWCLYVFCLLFFCHAPRPARCSLEGCIVRTSIAFPFIGRFRRGFQLFLSEEIALSCALHSSHFVARWRHRFREIVVKNFEKSKNWRKRLCALSYRLYLYIENSVSISYR